MSKPDKAQITYKVGESDSVLRFHAVIAEEHEITSEVTKYPAMTGFDISTHAIKKNRKVTIRGMVSNHVILGAEEAHDYGGKNTAIVFDTLKNLVRGAVPCEVLTNLGTYDPVIFTRFRTKQQAGMTDAMDFTLIGEEIQLGNSVNSTAPKLLIFTPVPEAEREARIEELEEAGLEVPPEAILTETQVDFNESFAFEETGANGEKFTTTYVKDGFDPSTNSYSHSVHTSEMDVAEPTTSGSFNWFGFLGDEDVIAEVVDPEEEFNATAALSTAGACLEDGAKGLLFDATNNYVNSALGYLKQTTYGLSYELFGVAGNASAGQVLLALGVDCLVAGAVSGSDPTVLGSEDFQDNNFPSSEEALAGAAGIGDGIVTSSLSAAAPTTLTKISNPAGETSFFGDLL